MTRLAFPLSLVALAVLAGCGGPDYYADRGTPVTTSSGPTVVTTQSAAAPAAVVSPGTVVTGQPILISSGPVQPGAVIVPAGNVFRAGMGTVEAVQALHIAPAPSASAGASLPERLAYRLSLKMDDGSMQAVDQDNPGFRVGDRVEIASNGRVVRR